MLPIVTQKVIKHLLIGKCEFLICSGKNKSSVTNRNVVLNLMFYQEVRVFFANDKILMITVLMSRSSDSLLSILPKPIFPFNRILFF